MNTALSITQKLLSQLWKLLRKITLSSLEMSTRNKSLAQLLASPQLHPGLKSMREYMKMNIFLSGQIMLNLSGVLLTMDVQFETHQLRLQTRNSMANMMSLKQWSTTTKVLQYCLIDKSNQNFLRIHPTTLNAPSRSCNFTHLW